jgi:hypothetical protein
MKHRTMAAVLCGICSVLAGIALAQVHDPRALEADPRLAEEPTWRSRRRSL